MQTYLFYDIETTGLNKAFDQVLQFAAIRTTLELREIERYEFKVRLNKDVIPSPYAIITHKIGLSQAQTGDKEFDVIKQIHALMNTPGTISLGYNTLGFDDEFLRFSFFRNLLKPYTHQYANQCYRADIFPMVVMFYLFQPDSLQWAYKEDGVISLKLEELNRINQFASGNAHDAMVDVEVTLELARKLSQSKDMWQYLLGYFDKNTDQTRMASLTKEMSLLIDSSFGAKNNFQSPVIHLGQHLYYKNQTIWLRLDLENLTELTFDNIREKTWAIAKKPGEPNFVLPCKDRFIKHLSPEKLTLALNNLVWLNERPDLFDALKKYHLNFQYPLVPNTDVEASLYQYGFWSREEESFCERFHQVSPEKKSALIETVTNKRLKELAIRILGRNFPDVLSESQQQQFKTFLSQAHTTEEDKCLIDFKGNKRLTFKAALQAIETIKQERALSENDLALLDHFKKFELEVN